MLDLVATSHFTRDPNGIKLTGPATKSVATANGAICNTKHSTKLLQPQLKNNAWVGYILLVLQKEGLMSVKALADDGYTTIFHA